MFEKDGRLVTKVDLSGIKKESIKVEVSDGFLTIDVSIHSKRIDVVLLD